MIKHEEVENPRHPRLQFANSTDPRRFHRLYPSRNPIYEALGPFRKSR